MSRSAANNMVGGAFLRAGCAFLLSATLLAACRQDMHDQPRHEPLEGSAFFSDGRAERPQVPGTVARGKLRLDKHLYEGTIQGSPAATFPIEIDEQALLRGRERYQIFCSPCHDGTGSGQGIVVQRGMQRPTGFQAERLVLSPPGYFFDVISNGFGAMYGYKDRIPATDRWLIVAYIRALQLSQNFSDDDLTIEERALLTAQDAPQGESGSQHAGGQESR